MEQHPQEFEWLKNKIAGASAILEIGSRYGDSLREFASICAPGAKIRAIDHGMASGECPNPTLNELRQTIADLRSKGFDADVYVGDSRDPAALAWAKAQGPFDFIFIDADHRYEGVKQDYEQYGPLAKKVGLHDIAFIATDHGVQKLWREIEASGAITQECVLSGGPGTGLVINVR